MTDRSTDSLLQTLVHWLEAQREAYLSAAHVAGIAPSVSLRIAVATAVEEHTATIKYDIRAVSPLAIPDVSWTLTRMVEEAGAQPAPAAELVGFFGESEVPWSPFSPDDVKKRVEMLLNAAAHEYLGELQSLETADLALAGNHARELVELFSADQVVVVTAVPLGGIKPPAQPVTVGHVRLRGLTPEEHGRLFEAGIGIIGQPAPRRTVRPFTFARASERVVIETRVPCDKRIQPADELAPHKLILGLQLLDFELHGGGSSTVWTEPGPTLSIGHPTISLAESGPARECTEDDLGRASSLAEAISDGAIWNPQSREDLVSHRFKLGVVEKSPVDSLVDYVVALESFLLGEKEGEYRFKFGLFGGWYLGDDPESRERIAKDLRDVYDVRSQIVHGTVPSVERVVKTVATARGLTSRMILKALESGWPSHEQLRRSCYG